MAAPRNTFRTKKKKKKKKRILQCKEKSTRESENKGLRARVTTTKTSILAIHPTKVGWWWGVGPSKKTEQVVREKKNENWAELASSGGERTWWH